MRYFKDENNKISALEDNADKKYIKDNWIEISELAKNKIKLFGTDEVSDEDYYAEVKKVSLTKAKSTNLKELETSYNSSIQQNIDYLDTVFQADFKSQELIKSTLTASGGVLPDGFYWKDLYNNEVSVTYEDLQGLATVIFIRGQSEWLKWQELKKLVSTAVSVNDLDDISWGS